MYPDADDASQAVSDLLDLSQDLIAVVDEDGVYRFANDAAEHVLGFDPRDLVGRPVCELIHPDDRDHVRSTFEALLEGEESGIEAGTEAVEYRHEAADGDWVWLESRIRRNPVAGMDGYAVSSRDVTGRKRAEQRHREAETRLHELAAHTDDVLWVYSGDWEELLFVNEAYEDVWGQSIERLCEEPTAFMEGIHPDDRPAVREAMQRLAAGESTDLEYRVNPGREFRRWVWVKGHPVVDDDGEVARIVGFARDITDRRRRERQLRLMDTLLRHNLRNEMNVVLGHAELCEDAADLGVVREHAAVILETGRELMRTAEKEREIVDLLVDGGIPEAIDLVTVLEEVRSRVLAAHSGAESGVELVVDDDGAVAEALPMVDRALEELLENAVVHAEGDPDVTVSLARLDGSVEVSIRDRGPAIPDNEYVPLFDADHLSQVYHGTGVGLWLVYWVVELSEGDIEFSSGGCGNEVTIRLPAAD